MKNKIIIFIILAIFFVPVISNAMIVEPHANLTIIVNTQGNDLSFNFELIEFPYYSEQINLETENLSSSIYVWLATLSGDEHYYLKQENVPGFKIDSIFCESDNPDDIFFYQSDSVSFFPINEENIVCTFNNIEVQEKNSVLIVPGIMGTEIKKEDELLWANVPAMLGSPTDDFMDLLAFNEDLTPVDSILSIGQVIKQEPFFNYTEGLIQEFASQGYVENETLFLFPYDWRYGVSGKYADGKTNVDLLAQKIQDILQQTGADKIDVVAHSNGGLLVKKYVIDNPVNHKINKAVFVGVPNTGAPKAIKALVQGDSMGISFAGLGLSESEMKKLAENMPVSYDLLPSQTYYDIKGSFIKMVDNKNPIDFFDGTEKDLNYQEFESYLNDKGLNSTAMANSENLHTPDFDNYDLRNNGIELYNIVGCKSSTMTGFTEVKNQNFFGDSYIKYGKINLKTGDGTVPIESATNLPISQENKFYILKTRHSNLLSQDGSRQEIVNLIAESSLEVSQNLVTQDIDKCELNGKGFSVFSPVDIFVEDQSGNRLGLAEDGSIINEIPGADFEIWGEQKFIFVPTDDGQIYITSLKGSGNGNFTIKIEDIQNTQITKTEIFSNLPVTPELTGTINIDLFSGTSSLTVKQAPDLQEQIILPDLTLTGEQDDFFSPVSSVTLSGESAVSKFYKSDVAIKIEAIDDDSGVLNMQYNLDNAGFQEAAGGLVDLAVKAEGNHTLIFFSTDKAGNNEQEQMVEFTIDKTAPEAVIEFDPELKDLKFTGKDNISEASDISILDEDNLITLKDQAGNTTEIKLKDKNRRILMRAEIKSIKYNGILADKNKNQMAFFWLYDKNKNLKILSQYVKSKNDYNILAVFNGKNTTFLGRDSSGKIFKTEKGLKIIKITTDKGNLSWGY
jgi:hypothetical protein